MGATADTGSPGRRALAEELRRLEQAAGVGRAGRSRAAAITAANAEREEWAPELVRSTVGDWFTKGSAPDVFEQLWALVAVLLSWSGSRDRPPPPVTPYWAARRAYWKQLWEQARQEPAPGRQTSAERASAPPLGLPVADLDPVRMLEVHPAIEAVGRPEDETLLPRYVERGHDQLLHEEVVQALHRSRLVVLVGDSSTGKTRALWEAVQRLPAQWRVWRPADQQTLLDGLADDRALPQTVVWLNESQRYLDTSSSDQRVAAALADLLASPLRGPVLVVGTLWRDHHAALTDAEDKNTPAAARALLRSGSSIAIPENFDDQALALLREEARDDARLAEALHRAGRRATQYLAGARELLYRYEHAPAEARAVLDAAADARRLGVGEAIPEAFLHAAAAAYLDADHWHTQTDQWRRTWFQQALTYTSRSCRGVPGPLTPNIALPGQQATGEPSFRLADYLHQHLQVHRRYIRPPTGFWDAALRHLTNAEDVFQLGRSARIRLRLRWADRLYRRAGDFGHWIALEILGSWRARIGDVDASEQFYRRAVPDSLLACSIVSGILERDGEAEAARELDDYLEAEIRIMQEEARPLEEYHRANRRGRLAEHEYADFSRMLLDLSWMRLEGGDREGAGRLAAWAAGLGLFSPVNNLAGRLRFAEDWAGYQYFTKIAADAGSLRALNDLSWLLERAGDREAAERHAQQAADRGSTRAMITLARWRAEAGRQAEAEELALQAAMEQARPYDGEERTAAAGLLIEWIHQHAEAGDRAGAEDLALRAALCKDPHPLLDLARRREQSGDAVGAEDIALRATDAGNYFALQELAESRTGPWGKLAWYGLEPDGSLSPPWHEHGRTLTPSDIKPAAASSSATPGQRRGSRRRRRSRRIPPA
ncbi:hypothetical protein [Streptomyces sp. IBSBF 3352]|uniref:hypothetical protein n=1 Tax=Streptomyces sp. IBSBF 3352 TaxID=2903523 RepID=UPI002FDC1522